MTYTTYLLKGEFCEDPRPQDFLYFDIETDVDLKQASGIPVEWITIHHLRHCPRSILSVVLSIIKRDFDTTSYVDQYGSVHITKYPCESPNWYVNVLVRFCEVIQLLLKPCQPIRTSWSLLPGSR